MSVKRKASDGDLGRTLGDIASREDETGDRIRIYAIGDFAPTERDEATILMKGPIGSLYQDVYIKIRLSMIEESRYSPTTMTCDPPLYHPNIAPDGKVGIQVSDIGGQQGPSYYNSMRRIEALTARFARLLFVADLRESLVKNADAARDWKVGKEVMEVKAVIKEEALIHKHREEYKNLKAELYRPPSTSKPAPADLASLTKKIREGGQASRSKGYSGAETKKWTNTLDLPATTARDISENPHLPSLGVARVSKRACFGSDARTEADVIIKQQAEVENDAAQKERERQKDNQGYRFGM